MSYNAIKSQAKSIGLVGKTKVKKPIKKSDDVVSVRAKIVAGMIESTKQKLDESESESEKHLTTIESIIEVLKAGDYTKKVPKNL